MKDPVALTPGDPCPNCGGAIAPAPVPSADQRRRAADRDHPEFLNPAMDTMTADQRAEHGALHRCVRCGYATRFPLVAAASR